MWRAPLRTCHNRCRLSLMRAVGKLNKSEVWSRRSVQEVVQDLSPRQGAGGKPPKDPLGPNSAVGKKVVSEGLTNNRLQTVEQAVQVGGGNQGREVQRIVGLAEGWVTNAPTIVPETSGIVDAQSLGQHVYASLLISTEIGTEAPLIANNTPPADQGLEAWRRLAQRFDPASAQANLNLASRSLKPRKGMINDISSMMDKLGRIGAPTGRTHSPPSRDRQCENNNHVGHVPSRLGTAPRSQFGPVRDMFEGQGCHHGLSGKNEAQVRPDGTRRDVGPSGRILGGRMGRGARRSNGTYKSISRARARGAPRVQDRDSRGKQWNKDEADYFPYRRQSCGAIAGKVST